MGQVETGDTVAYCPDPPLTDRWLCRGGGVNRRAATTAKPPLHLLLRYHNLSHYLQVVEHRSTVGTLFWNMLPTNYPNVPIIYDIKQPAALRAPLM